MAGRPANADCGLVSVNVGANADGGGVALAGAPALGV